MGDLANLKRGQIIGACLAGAAATKIATLLGVWDVWSGKQQTCFLTHHK
jgi:hypothetical protein